MTLFIALYCLQQFFFCLFGHFVSFLSGDGMYHVVDWPIYIAILTAVFLMETFVEGYLKNQCLRLTLLNQDLEV